MARRAKVFAIVFLLLTLGFSPLKHLRYSEMKLRSAANIISDHLSSLRWMKEIEALEATV